MTNPTFHELGLNSTMQHVVNELYFTSPTSIQKKAIPAILARENIIGQSATGSGKTHAYLLPLLNKIKEEKREVQIVITVPTRELALQVFEEVRTVINLANKAEAWFARLITGGIDRERMIKQLETPPQIIVGTPGRIADMVQVGALSIYSA